MRYIALLRGVNFGGKNKISMPKLKSAFEQNGFQNVNTYINSGNVLFDSDLHEMDIQRLCCKVIADKFCLEILVAVISQNELEESLAQAPDWWDNKPSCIHNTVFVIAPKSPQEILGLLKSIEDENEKIASVDRIIFWSAPSEKFYSTKSAKLIHSEAVYKYVTVRGANTTKKLAKLTR